jgi:uncharacterized membrane protein (Fun14 family)
LYAKAYRKFKLFVNSCQLLNVYGVLSVNVDKPFGVSTLGADCDGIAHAANITTLPNESARRVPSLTKHRGAPLVPGAAADVPADAGRVVGCRCAAAVVGFALGFARSARSAPVSNKSGGRHAFGL